MMLIGTRVVLVVVLALALSACGVRYLYSQLDWLVPWYVRDYVTLEAGQRALLATRLAERLDWHCRSQLPVYSEWLRSAAGSVAATRLEHAELEHHAKRAEMYVRALMAALADDMPDLLAALSDKQIAELFGNLDGLNERIREEYLDAPEPELRARQAERMEKRLRRWFGGLNAEQRKLVEAWSIRLTPVAEEWFAHRLDWQQQLQEALRQRHDRPTFDALVARLLINPDSGWSASYRAGVVHNRALTLALLADLHALATPRQRSRLLREIDSLTRQFDKLACDGPSRQTRRQARAASR